MSLYLQIHGIFATDVWAGPGDNWHYFLTWRHKPGWRGRIPASGRRNAIDMGVPLERGDGLFKTTRPAKSALASALNAGVPWEKAALLVLAIHSALCSARRRPVPHARTLGEALAYILSAFPLPPEPGEGENHDLYVQRARDWLCRQPGISHQYLREFRWIHPFDTRDIDAKRSRALRAPFLACVTRADRDAISRSVTRLCALYNQNPGHFDEVLEGLVRGEGLEHFRANFSQHDDLVVAARLVAAAPTQSLVAPLTIAPMTTTHACAVEDARIVPADPASFDDESCQLSREGPLAEGHHGLNVYYQHAALDLRKLAGALRRPEDHLHFIIERFLDGFTSAKLPRFRHSGEGHQVSKYFLIAEILNSSRVDLSHLFAQAVPADPDLFSRSVDRLINGHRSLRRHNDFVAS